MDVFALLFVVSFLALIFTLVVMHIRKCIKTKDNVAKGSKHIIWVSDMLGRGSSKFTILYDLSLDRDRSVDTIHKVKGDGSVQFAGCWWDGDSWMKREVNAAQEYGNIVGKTTYEFETSWYQKELNKTQEKWKETLPHPSTRLKNRKKRKGKK